MELRGLFEEAVQAYGGLPVDTEFRDKNTTIKRRTVIGNEQYILERKDEGVTPDKLMKIPDGIYADLWAQHQRHS